MIVKYENPNTAENFNIEKHYEQFLLILLNLLARDYFLDHHKCEPIVAKINQKIKLKKYGL